MHRRSLGAAAIGAFASVAVTSAPARATPCTNLQSLSLEHMDPRDCKFDPKVLQCTARPRA
jgi:hypothetical protein